MADATREVGFVISAENELSPELKQTSKTAKAAETAIKRFGSVGKKALAGIKAAGAKISGMFRGIGSAMLSLKGLIAGFVAFMVARGLISFFRESTELAKIQQNAVLELGATLAQVGATDVAAASTNLQEFASSLQAVTTTGDETTLGLLGLGLRLGLTQEQAKEATTVALDLAAATGKSLREAMVLTSKAALGEVGALGDLGIKIDASKSASEKAAEAMARLNAQFGGAAQAQARTFSGAITQLGNTWGDLKEILGGVITENQTVRAAIIELNKVLADLGGSLNESREESQDLVDRGFNVLLDGIQAVIKVVNFLRKTFKGLQVVGSAVVLAMVKGFQLMRDVTLGFFRPLTMLVEKVGEFAGMDVTGLRDGLQSISNVGSDLEATLTSTINKTAQEMVNIDGATDSAIRRINTYRDRVAQTAKSIANDFAPAVKKASDQITEGGPVKKLTEGGPDAVAQIEAMQKAQDDYNASIAQGSEAQREIMSRQAAAATNAISSAQDVGAAIGASLDALLTGAKAIDQVFAELTQTMLQGIVSAVENAILAFAAQAAAAQLAAHAFLPFVGIVVGTAAASAIFALVKALIGRIPAAAMGGEVIGGIAGRDSVPAMLMPGERVLTVGENRDLKKFVRSVLGPVGDIKPVRSAPLLGMATGGVVSSGPALAHSAPGFGNTTINMEIKTVSPSDMTTRKRAYREIWRELIRNRARKPFSGRP